MSLFINGLHKLTRDFSNLLLIIVFALAFSPSLKAEESEVSTNSSSSAVNVTYNQEKGTFLIVAGKLHLEVPEFPELEPKDIPPGKTLEQAKAEYLAEYESLSEDEKVQFLENRIQFLTTGVKMFRMLRIVLTPAGWAFTSANWVSDQTKKGWNATKKGTVNAWNSTLKWMGFGKEEDSTEQAKGDGESNPGEEMQIPVSVEAEAEAQTSLKVDLLADALVGLNKTLLQKARTVLSANEFGITIGTGASANLGYKTDSSNMALGGVTDLWLHMGKKKDQNAYVLTIQNVNEYAKNTHSAISVLAGIDAKLGFYFNNPEESTTHKGGSYYPAESVNGISVYGGRIIAWGFATEMGPLVGNDFMGYDTSGVAIDLVHLEGSRLYPLFFKVGDKALISTFFKAIGRFTQQSYRAIVPGNKCIESLNTSALGI